MALMGILDVQRRPQGRQLDSSASSTTEPRMQVDGLLGGRLCYEWLENASVDIDAENLPSVLQERPHGEL
jgi:hypothetical protein